MPSPPHLRRLLVPVAGALAVAAAGCGGSHNAGAPAAAGSPPAKLPGGRIVFRRYLDAAKTHGALFTVNPDGTGEAQITAPPVGTVDDNPDWSPDGRRIAFERCDSRNGCQVFTIAPDGTGERHVPERCRLSRVCQLSNPAWTPDGRLVATLADGGDRLDPPSGDRAWPQASRLVLIDLERHTQRTLVRRGHWTGVAESPAVSPDGRTVLYTRANTSRSAPAFGGALFVVGLDGRQDHRITPWSLGGGDHPGFAPDGTILFRSYEDDDARQSDYWTVRPDGSGLRRLTHFEPGTTVLSTSYSADGRWIAYGTSGVAGNADVFVMRADGVGARPVTRSRLWDSAPDWGPPG
jgi:Tol biopolymer transport system component